MSDKTTASIEGVWHGETIIVDMRTAQVKGFVTSARKIASRAKTLVGVGPGDPEHLRETIRVREGKKDKSAVYVIAGNRRRGVYWHFMHEFGTFFSSAHPFMRPAVDMNFNATLAEATRRGKRELNRVRRVSARTKRIKAGLKR